MARGGSWALGKPSTERFTVFLRLRAMTTTLVAKARCAREFPPTRLAGCFSGSWEFVGGNGSAMVCSSHLALAFRRQRSPAFIFGSSAYLLSVVFAATGVCDCR